MENHSFLTPKERTKLIVNSAIAGSFNKLIHSHTKRIESISSESDHSTGDSCDNSVVPTSTDPPSNDAITSDVPNNSTWNNSSSFYVSMLNYSLGFGSVLTFPTLCYKHGGGETCCSLF